MHPNEIRINSTNIIELYELAEQLGPSYHVALREQITRQELEKYKKLETEVLCTQMKHF